MRLIGVKGVASLKSEEPAMKPAKAVGKGGNSDRSPQPVSRASGFQGQENENASWPLHAKTFSL